MITFLTHAIAFAVGFCFASWLMCQPLKWLDAILKHNPKG